jgi:MarR family transcriptional regulator, temperature-dependent positive regulator of motility
MKPNLNDKYYLLKELEKEEKQSQREQAKVLGFSLGKLNFVLKAPIAKGLVKMENFAHNEQKIQYRYILTPEGINEKIRVTGAFFKCKEAEYEKILLEIDEACQTMWNDKFSRWLPVTVLAETGCQGLVSTKYFEDDVLRFIDIK